MTVEAALGCVADDYTGGTDVASALRREGLVTLLLFGPPRPDWSAGDADAVVVALKSRNLTPADAVALSLAAQRWLREQGIGRLYFKYCSTFDSTDEGNSGPVADALLEAAGAPLTVVCPASPEHGRTVHQGHLFGAARRAGRPPARWSTASGSTGWWSPARRTSASPGWSPSARLRWPCSSSRATSANPWPRGGPMTHATPERLTDFATAVLEAEGVPADDAGLIARCLLQAELWGHPSHGMLRLSWYVARIRSGVVDPAAKAETVVDRGPLALLDGREGLGHVVCAHAANEAVRRAREHGVGVVGVRNSNHFGMAAHFTRMIAEQGCVGVVTTNGSPAMAPWGGREKAVGANPWSIAAPAGRHGVTVMDIANVNAARGKIYAARERGATIPEGWALDAEGRPTTDPAAAIAGVILPMGGHKGYAISFMMDVLSGVLTGSSFATGVSGPQQAERRSGCGHMVLAVDVAAVADPDGFAERMEALIAEMKAVPLASGFEEIFYPGEIEDRSRARREREGIEVPAKTLEALERLAAETGVPLALD
jgi:LDH2 family malate/lactate/ureidoglycolate dehydrogenase